MTDPICHDFTRGTERNGWGIIRFDFIDQQRVKVSAFGLKPRTSAKSLEDFYLLEGEELVMSLPDGAALYQIVTINYVSDYDCFEAELKYIQHLTGLKVMGLRDKKQNDRAIAWGERITKNGAPNEDNAALSL